MDHSEAVEQMTAERYLLGELTPEARDAFEEHMFDCPECAEDLRVAAVFVEEAKVQLPALTENLPARQPANPDKASSGKTGSKSDRWSFWWRPAFTVPVFAALLAVVGYQNIVTLPALNKAANQPRLVPWVPLRGAVRGEGHLQVTADREHGVSLPVDLIQPLDSAPYTLFTFVLSDSQGKSLWTGSVAAPAGGQRVSLSIPGTMLATGTYTVAVTGIGAHGESSPVEQYVFDLRLTD